MKNEALKDSIEFWENQNIIYCKIKNNFNNKYIGLELEEAFSCAISNLSDGKYMPVLIRMPKTNFLASINLFRFLSKNQLIQTLVLSKTFLVQSKFLKVILCMYCFCMVPIVSNRVFNIYSTAIKDCKKRYLQFNLVG